MVTLPTTPNTVPQVRAPTPGVSPSQVAAPSLELAHTLDVAAKETGDVAKLYAHEAGLKAVTRDADGNLRVDRLPIIGDAAIPYEHAIKYAALADGEGVARRDDIALREKHHNDPDGYAKAADAYKQEKIAQYSKAAGTEVGIALGKSIDHQTTLTYKGLLNEKERLDLARSTASIETQVQTASNELYALKAQGLPDSAPEIQQRLQTIGAGWGTLQNNPRLAIPKERVEFEMSRLKSEMAVAGMGYRTSEILKNDGPEAAASYVDQIRTDPKLNLTPSERFSLHSRLMQGIKQQISAQDATNKVVAGELKAVSDQALEGVPATPERMGVLRQQVAASGNPELAGALRHIETIQPTIASWIKSDPATLSRTLTDLDRYRREHGDDTGSMGVLKGAGEKLLANMRKGIQSDPLDWADKSGALPVPPIDFASKDVSSQLRDRVARAEQVGAQYGIQPSYLRPEERAIIEKVTAAGGAPMLQMAATIVDGAGNRAPKMLAEVSKESPVLAHIGGLMTMNGSPGLMRDAAEAVTLRQDKTFKHPRWLDKESDSIQTEQHKGTLETYGGAFFLEPDTGRAAAMTAQAAFFTRSARGAGFDPKLESTDAKKLYSRSLQEAAGATFQPDGTQIGGIATYKPGYWTNYKVLVPNNMKQDSFGSVIGAIKDEDIAGAQGADGKSYTAHDLRRAVPVAVRGGYRFAVGDPMSDDPQWIRGRDGNPFVLDLERLEPALRKRVPGAYAGH